MRPVVLTHEIPFGPYLLLGRLNAGGMAEVFLAKGCHPPLDGKLLALKRILPRYSDDPDFVSMFMDEARILAQLTHPHICAVYDQGQLHDQLYLVMEFIHGKDLAVLKQRAAQQHHTLPYGISAWIIARIADALDHAHTQRTSQGKHIGIVHRDVCPTNIIVSYDGVPKLIDFGIATASERFTQTRAGVIKGKAIYMSPEQVQGKAIDGRSDVFGLGQVLYELLTGKTPFDAPTEYDVLRNITQGDYRPLDARTLKIPEVLCQAVHRALQRDPALRFQRARDLAEALALAVAFAERQLKHPIMQDTVAAYMREHFAAEYALELRRMTQFMGVHVPEVMEASHTLAIDTNTPRPQSSTSGRHPTQHHYDTVGDHTIEYPVRTDGRPMLDPDIAQQIATSSLAEAHPGENNTHVTALANGGSVKETDFAEDLQELAPGFLQDPRISMPRAAHLNTDDYQVKRAWQRRAAWLLAIAIGIGTYIALML